MAIAKDIFGTGSRPQVIMIVILFTIITGAFSYVNWSFNEKFFLKATTVILITLLFVWGKPKVNLNFQYPVLALAFIPFFSIIYSFTEYNQPILDGINATLPSLIWLLYFFLHRWKVQESSIMQAFFYIALFVAAVQIIQQVTYPVVLFGVPSEEELAAGEELASQRNGLWRFHIGNNAYFTALVLFAIWIKLNDKFSVKEIILSIVLLVSVYLTLTRQIIFSTVLTLTTSYIIYKKKVKAWGGMLGIVLIVIIYQYLDILFGEFIVLTQEDSTKDYIRILAAQYFWSESISSTKSFLLGHGMPASGTFLQLDQTLKENYHYYVSDVGFIGMIWRFGLPYVLVCYFIFYRLFVTFRKKIPLYIRLFVMYTTIMSIMIFPMHRPLQYIIWCFILYICDLSINPTLNPDKITEKEQDESPDSMPPYKGHRPWTSAEIFILKEIRKRKLQKETV